MENKVAQIAIIGCGPMGMVYLGKTLQLIQKDQLGINSMIQIVVFESQQSIGRGIAFGKGHSAHRINTLNSAMGIFEDNPLHFIDWMENNPQKWQKDFPDYDPHEDHYAPRKLYALYLEDMAAYFKKWARGMGVSLKFVNQEVTNLENDQSHFLVDTRNGQSFVVNYVVLALGNFKSTTRSYLNHIKKFISNPYLELGTRNNIHVYDDILLLGSGLTAIDTAIALYKEGHKGKITLVSRNGWLPKVQALRPKPPHELKFLTKSVILSTVKEKGEGLTIKEIELLVLKEAIQTGITQHELKEIMKLDLPTKTILQNDLQRAKSGEDLSQSILYALSALMPILWHNLQLKEKRKFNGESLSKWSIFKHPMIYSKALIIYEMLDKGILEVKKGAQRPLYYHKSEKFIVPIGYNGEIVESDVLIDCTGVHYNLNNVKNPLVKALVKKGVLVADEFGGCKTRYFTGEIISNMQNVKRIFAVGALTRGAMFYVNAFTTIRNSTTRTAEAIYSDIIQNISQE